MYLATSIIFIFLLLAVYIFQQPQFGKLPSGERFERIKKSPNYKNGAFQNQSYTPVLAEGVNFFTVGKEFLKASNKRIRPVDEIPSTKADLINLDENTDAMVWFGHSSYFIQIDGKKILVDCF